MAICNIFKQLNKSTGTFLLFSQYSEDLTVQHSNSNYKVVPSKFYVCDIDYTNFDNQSLPLLLQNKFENGCAYLKDTIAEWNPNTSKTLFWNAVQDLIVTSNIVNELGEETNRYKTSIVSVNDINIQSYTSKDNIGYNEIYCYIPNDAKKLQVEVIKNTNIDQTSFIPYDKEYIVGYNDNDKTISGIIDITASNLFEYNGNVGYYTTDLYTFDVEDKYTSLEDTLFNFNTIIVTYDIYVDNEVLYKEIPMGIYFTGVITNNEMTNPVTKFVSNNDIYGAGTSYGLRICSRFTVTPNSTSIKSEVDSVQGDDLDYAAFSQAMSQMAESQIKMDDILENINGYQNGIKNHIMSITENKVNVPYIREVNGVNYWFCNGKNLNVTVQGPKGNDGEKGEQGEAGLPGLTVKGTISDVSELNYILANYNDAYFIEGSTQTDIDKSDGALYVYNGNTFEYITNLKGPKGDSSSSGTTEYVTINETGEGNAVRIISSVPNSNIIEVVYDNYVTQNDFDEFKKDFNGASITLKSEGSGNAVKSINLQDNELKVLYDDYTSSSDFNKEISDIKQQLSGGSQSPTGTILMFAGDSSKIPTGWLLCDGKNYNISTYSNLFNVIGTTYGGDGTSSFNVPNLIQRFPMGGTNLGEIGGNSQITLTQEQTPLKEHTHVASSSLSGSVPKLNDNDYILSGDQEEFSTISVGDDITVSTSIYKASDDSASPIDITPPYITLNFIIKY